jgi:hypothetical protein
MRVHQYINDKILTIENLTWITKTFFIWIYTTKKWYSQKSYNMQSFKRLPIKHSISFDLRYGITHQK